MIRLNFESRGNDFINNKTPFLAFIKVSLLIKYEESRTKVRHKGSVDISYF